MEMRNRRVGFRVVDRSGKVLSTWGWLALEDLIPGDDCWGKLVFGCERAAVMTERGEPKMVQVAINTWAPSMMYDIPLDFDEDEVEPRVLEVGQEVTVYRVMIEVEGSRIVWGGDEDEEGEE